MLFGNTIFGLDQPKALEVYFKRYAALNNKKCEIILNKKLNTLF